MRKLIFIAVAAFALVAITATAFAAKSIKVGDDYYVRSAGVPKVTVSTLKVMEQTGDTKLLHWLARNIEDGTVSV